MKNNASKYFLLLTLTALLFTSCKKFLNDLPKTALTTGNSYNTASDMENQLAGCYHIFYGTDYYQWEYVMVSDVRSDNAYPGGGNEETFYQYDRSILAPSNHHNYVNWSALYGGIGQCNILLDKITAVTDPALSTERRDQIIGETSFLRAFHYAQLVKLYGGVPIELLSNTPDPAVIRKPRATEKEVYDQIVKDLETAVSKLPDTYGSDPAVNKVRATKGAANAMLAKVWAQRSDRDYTKVLQYCNAVISGAGNYSLMNNYADLFDGSHYLNSESILEIPFAEGTPNASWGVELYLAPEDGWQKYCIPSKDLVAAYDAAGDEIRKNASIIFMTEDANGDPISWADENWNPCQDAATAVPFNYKQKHPAGWASGDDYYLIRLADIILLKAEAENELGNTAEAAADVNIVRARVHLDPIASTLSKEQMKAAILNERRLELAFEGQRWDDLIRTGVATTVMQALNEETFTCTDGVLSAPEKMDYSHCTPDHWIFPIPQLEIDANPNLVQNPGY